MPFARAIFNKRGRFHWYQNEHDLIVSLSKRDLNQTWFVADLYYPEFPNYDFRMHKQEIAVLLETPNELIEFKLSDELKRQVLELIERIK